MKREIFNKEKNKYANFFVIIFFFFLLCLTIRLGYLCLSNKVDGINLKELSKKRITAKETLYSLRGTIYDTNNETLAQTINSYKIIAYLEKNRGEGYYIKDKKEAAKKLSTVLELSEEKIYKILSKDAYQVEFGSKGKGLNELQKEAIENLGLDGIDFIATHKRYYPNNDFLSYILGYTTQDEEGNIKGQMGIEKEYNDLMTGVNGSVEYEKDKNGYKFPNSNEIRKEKIDGNDVYLTIDSNVQMSLESIVKKADEEAKPDWMIAVVADAKTGKILGSATAPSFNPNTKNIENYLNPLVSYTYEPGSVMKTYTYMAAFENDPSFNVLDTFESAPYEIGEYTVKDWNKTGFGTITYERGFSLSANTGIVNIIKNHLSRNILKDYYKSLGFGSKTNIELPSEYSGKINFKYDIEVANAGFGQGVTTTAIQQVKALTSISNNGVVLNPYIVEKVVNPTTGEIMYEASVKEGEKVASIDTINKIKDLMYKVTHGDSSTTTGYLYQMDGYDLIGKTGTAQIANPKTGKYYTGSKDYITSFAGMYPKDDPKVIIYVAMQRSKVGSVLSDTVKTITKDTAKYLEIFDEEPQLEKEVHNYKMGNYKNSLLVNVKKELDDKKANYMIIGSGTKVIDQYPIKNTKVDTKQRVYIFTNDYQNIMPNLVGLSYKDAKVILDKYKLIYEIKSGDYIKKQNIKAGTNIGATTKIIIE